MIPRFCASVGGVLILCSVGLCQSGGNEAGAPDGVGGKEVNEFQLSIVTDKSVYLAGEAVSFVIALKNLSDKKRSIIVTSIPFLYKFKMLAADGTPVPLTGEGRKVLGERIFFGSVGGKILEPGGRITINVSQMNRLYDMTLTGEYKISVSTKVPSLDGKKDSPISSNSVKIRIRQPADGSGLTWGWGSYRSRKPRHTHTVKQAPQEQPEGSPSTESEKQDAEEKPEAVGAADKQGAWLFSFAGLGAGTVLGALLAWALLRKRLASA